MKVQIICENCGKVVELTPETLGNGCYVQSKLNDKNMYCDVNIDTQVTTDIEDINDIDDIDVESTLDNIRFTCRDCGQYIELNNLK